MSSSDDQKTCLGDETEQLRAEVEGLQLAVSVARETNGELRTSACLARAQADALRVDLELREDEITSLRTDHRAALARATRAEAELAEARSTIEAVETTLAGRDQDIASRDAHIAIAERGIEERDQQLATFCKQLDQSSEQFALFEGEIQSQRAVLEGARHAIALRDDRIAHLQDTLRSVEQLSSGAAGVEALPRPQIAVAPMPAPVMGAAPALAPVAVPAQAQAPAVVPAPPAQPVPAAAPAAPRAPAAEPTVTEAQPVADATSEAADSRPEPPIEPEPAAAATAEAADTVPAETTAATETAAEPEPAAPEASEAVSGDEAAGETPTPEPTPQPEAAAEPEEEQPFFYEVVPPLITPVFRYWRDSEIEKHHPDEATTSVDLLFYGHVAAACKARPDDTIHLWSLGGGDTQIEVRIAALLKEGQLTNYLFHILDSQPKRLKKQRTMIVNGLELQERLEIHEGELENWPADAPCDFVIADGSISSAKDPEALLDRIKRACGADGLLMLTDRIGDSAPLPEAATGAVNGIFETLTERQRKNKIEGATDDAFIDRREAADDSQTTRMVALLEDRFSFEVKLTAGNLIDTLTGPEYGPNFRVKEPEDCAIVDRLAALDQEFMSSENLEPRFLVAVLRTGEVSEPMLLGCAAAS